jgi:hypothetical protein
MTVTPMSSTTTAADQDRAVLNALREVLTEREAAYCTSAELAGDCPLSTNQVAKALQRLRDREDPPVTVEAWSHNGRATTWRVTDGGQS